MLVNIELIKPSLHPIRSARDDAKMDELVQSIEEHGILVPLMVRPDGDGYELIDGHRRLEAAQRAGLEEVPIDLRQMSDADAMAAALIAELQREDASPLDRARALRALMDAKGWNAMDVERARIMFHNEVSYLLQIIQQPEDVQAYFMEDNFQKRLTSWHIHKTGSLANEPTLRSDVLRKAGREELSTQAVQRVAESVAAAPSEEAKQRLIEIPYSPTRHDPDFIRERAKRYGANDSMYRPLPPLTTESPGREWEKAPEVINILSKIKNWQDDLDLFIRADDLGKISPEGRQFIAVKIRKLARAFNQWADDLEVNNE